MNKKFIKDELNEYNIRYMCLPYLSMSKYVDQIMKWYQVFSKDQILVLNLDDMESNLEMTLKQTFEFLNLENHEINNKEKKNVGKYNVMNEQTRLNLIEFYKPYNKKLII